MLVPSQRLAFERGRRMFRLQQKRPPGHALADTCTFEWLGYMAERAADCMARQKICELLGGNPEKVRPRD